MDTSIRDRILAASTKGDHSEIKALAKESQLLDADQAEELRNQLVISTAEKHTHPSIYHAIRLVSRGPVAYRVYDSPNPALKDTAWLLNRAAFIIDTGIYSLSKRDLVFYLLQAMRRKGMLAIRIAEYWYENLKGHTLSIGLAICCSADDVKMLEVLMDYHKVEIKSNPNLLKHALLHCCSTRDIETTLFILERCDSSMHDEAVQMWAYGGDLEAVKILLERRPKSIGASYGLGYACILGDMDMVELLIKEVDDTIDKSICRWVFDNACITGHIPIISMIAEHYWLLLEFKPDFSCLFECGIVDPKVYAFLHSKYGTPLKRPHIQIPSTLQPGDYTRTRVHHYECIISYYWRRIYYKLRDDKKAGICADVV